MQIRTLGPAPALTSGRPSGAAKPTTQQTASKDGQERRVDTLTRQTESPGQVYTGRLATAFGTKSFLARNARALAGTALGLAGGVAIGLAGGALGAVAGAVAAPVLGVIGAIGGATLAGKAAMDSFLKNKSELSTLILGVPMAIGAGLAVGGTAGFVAGGLLGAAGGAAGGLLGAGAVGLTLGALGGAAGHIADAGKG